MLKKIIYNLEKKKRFFMTYISLGIKKLLLTLLSMLDVFVVRLKFLIKPKSVRQGSFALLSKSTSVFKSAIVDIKL